MFSRGLLESGICRYCTNPNLATYRTLEYLERLTVMMPK